MRRRSAAVVVVIAAVGSAPAVASSIGHRTLLLSKTSYGAPALEDVSQGAIAGRGNVAAYVARTPDLRVPGGTRTDVFVTNLTGSKRSVISRAPDGATANGLSGQPSLSRSGARVAFASSASNLVAGDTNEATDVFVRDHSGIPVVVSVAQGGAQADGPSGQPDISANGRFVAFSSAASNLVPNDTNGHIDVFIRDLTTRATVRASVSGPGGGPDGDSTSPAMSADGSTVAFASKATNLVTGDTNGVADVFVRSADGSVRRVSISSTGRQQNKAVAAPFSPAPDVSGDGRYVVFDTDATNLYRSDRNRRTDVYIRDRKARTTKLVSASSVNVQGNNDSVTPRITPDGRFVTFQSFASNLFPADPAGADLFLRDRRTDTTSLVNATDRGTRRHAEPGGFAALQTVPINDKGTAAGFVSAAANVTSAQSAGVPQLYLRRLAAPKIFFSARVSRAGGLVGVYTRTNTKAATRFLCRVDRSAPYYCDATVVLPRRSGRRLTIRAGGPGMRWSSALTVVLSAR